VGFVAAVNEEARQKPNRHINSSWFLGSLAASSVVAASATAADDDSEVQIVERPKTALTNSGDNSSRQDMQTFEGKKMTPVEVQAKLLQLRVSGRVAGWKKVDVVMVDDTSKPPSKKQAKLRCRECDALLCASNPSRLFGDHYDKATGTCKDKLKKQEKVSFLQYRLV
jgi:hypothetical protein